MLIAPADGRAPSESRDTVATFLADRMHVLLVIRGDGDEVRAFVDEATPFEQVETRRIAWVMDSAAFPPGEEVRLFEDQGDVCAACVDWDGNVVARLSASADWVEIQDALMAAEGV